MVQEIEEDIDDLHMSDKQRRKSQIADWFASSSFAEQQSDLLARRHAGTATWFLQSPQYTDWWQGSNATLFCPGIPGSGKTIIVATVVDDLRRRFNQQTGVLIAYLYCNFRRSSQQTLGYMLATLVRQLFQERTDTPKLVEELHRKHEGQKTRPSIDELRTLLCDLVQGYTTVFFVVDALDECTTTDRSRDKLLNELFNLQMQLRGNVNLLCTSRPIPDVTNRFQSALRLEIVATKEDVEAYLDERMLELCSGIRKNRGLQQEIKAKITAVVGGM